METIRMFLRDKIDQKGIKLTYLASKLGISIDLVSKCINGTRKISAEEFLKMCKLLDVSQDEIMALSSALADVIGDTA